MDRARLRMAVTGVQASAVLPPPFPNPADRSGTPDRDQGTVSAVTSNDVSAVAYHS